MQLTKKKKLQMQLSEAKKQGGEQKKKRGGQVTSYGQGVDVSAPPLETKFPFNM